MCSLTFNKYIYLMICTLSIMCTHNLYHYQSNGPVPRGVTLYDMYPCLPAPQHVHNVQHPYIYLTNYIQLYYIISLSYNTCLVSKCVFFLRCVYATERVI